LIADYHTHNYLCKHADGTIEEYIRHAQHIGLKEIGCSDHSPMPNEWDSAVRMTEDQFYKEYKPTILTLKEQYKGSIDVKFGIEADFFRGTEEWVRTFLGNNEFDYVIGSVHYLGEWGFDNPIFVHRYEEQDIDSVYEQYYKHIQQSARSGLFDIIAHCDLVKKFGHRPKKNLEEILRTTFKVIKEFDLAVEINTSGLRKPIKEMYPSESILSIIGELHIPLTLGSDAHSPTDVGKDFSLASQFIQKYGQGRLSVFSNRQRSEVRL
jgi:histidinol-phosphatase (PHP family)